MITQRAPEVRRWWNRGGGKGDSDCTSKCLTGVASIYAQQVYLMRCSRWPRTFGVQWQPSPGLKRPRLRCGKIARFAKFGRVVARKNTSAPHYLPRCACPGARPKPGVFLGRGRGRQAAAGGMPLAAKTVLQHDQEPCVNTREPEAHKFVSRLHPVFSLRRPTNTQARGQERRAKNAGKCVTPRMRRRTKGRAYAQNRRAASLGRDYRL